MYCRLSILHAAERQEIMSYLENNVIWPYHRPWHKLSHGLYKHLVLPWHVEPTVLGFSKHEGNCEWIEWNKDGHADEGMDFLIVNEVKLAQMEKMLGTASMVTRWRESYPKLAGTNQDCGKAMINTLANILGQKHKDTYWCINGAFAIQGRRVIVLWAIDGRAVTWKSAGLV